MQKLVVVATVVGKNVGHDRELKRGYFKAPGLSRIKLWRITSHTHCTTRTAEPRGSLGIYVNLYDR